MVSPTVTLVYNIFYFPSIRPVCDLRDDFFCIQRWQEQSGKAEEEKYAHQRRGRFLHFTRGRMPALTRLGLAITFAEKFNPRQVARQQKAINGSIEKRNRKTLKQGIIKKENGQPD